jgi:carboxylesterase
MLADRAHAIRDQKMHGGGPMELHGGGNSPALVAFHGFGGTAAELMPTLRAVTAEGFAVEGPLLPGHGTKVEDLQGETFDSWLAFARSRAEAAAAGHGRVVLLGFSLGSLLALQLASHRPAWLAGIAILGNAITVRPHTSIPLGVWDWTGRAMPDVYFKKPLAADLVDPTILDTIVTYDRHPMRAALEVYRAGLRVKPLVGRVEAPALVLHGRRDRVCHWRNAPWVATHLGSRDVSVRIFERSAHVLACDGERDEVAAEVVRFMKRFS